MDVWLAWRFLAMRSEQGYLEKMGLQNSGNLYLLNGEDCTLQAVTYDFRHRRERGLVYLMLVTEMHRTRHRTCPGTHKFFYYPGKEKKNENILKMEDFEVLESKPSPHMGTCGM